jgi:CubicO group peptidase (beta-lactamase class C family)
VVTRNQKTDGKIVEIPNPNPIPATVRGDGGLYSTAPDYARFVTMMLNHGQLGGVRLLKEQTVRDMTRNHTGSVKVRLQPSAEPQRSKPYPLGAGEDVWALGFQLAAPAKPNPNMRRPGSLNWAGINNTYFWIDPERQIGAIVLMQMLPFYDDAAIQVLRGVEEQVYRHLR